MSRKALSAFLALFLACGGVEANSSGFTGSTSPVSTTGPASSTGPELESSSSTGEDSAASTSSSGGSDGPRLDMAVPDLGPGDSVGCQGKIDFVFVISTSNTMEPVQKQMMTSLPGFMATLAERFTEFDVRVLSAKPNAWWALQDCASCLDEACDLNGVPPACGVVPEPCDDQIGAGVTFPAGVDAANRRCDFFGGNRYIVGDEPDFAEALACVTQSGMNGASAHTAEAMVAAISSEFNGPGGCNEGFLRDDALLVVTLMSDMFDQLSKGTVESWINALRTAKHGDDDAFAIIVLTTDVDVGYWQLCLPEMYSPIKNRLRLLVEGVEHGFISSICEEDFSPFFAEAVDEIVELCDGLVLPR